MILSFFRALESRWQDYVREVEKKSEEEREINNSKVKGDVKKILNGS